MEFLDIWWVSSVQDEKQFRPANCEECKNWIQTSRHCNAGIPFTPWLVFSDNVAVFRCAWWTRGWDFDGKSQCQRTVFRCEEFDACNPDWRPEHSTGCGTPDNPNCKALDKKEVVRIETREWETTCLHPEGECTPCWSRMGWGRASLTKDFVERYISQGASGVWRVHRWRLGCFSLVLGDTEDRNDISGQWYTEWPLNTRVDSPIFRWLRDTYLPMLVNAAAEYPELDKDEASNEVLLHNPRSNSPALTCAPPSQKAVQFCPLLGQVRHLKWWLTKFFADHLDSF